MKRLLAAAVVQAAASSLASAQGVTVSLTEFKVQLSRDTVRAGRVTFQITNNGTTNHQLRVVGPETGKESAILPKKQGASLTLTLKPGTYEVFCPLSADSHKMAGMTAKLIVVAPPPPPAKKP
jgi:plastocyanin